MTLNEATAMLGAAIKQAWPNLAKASELPFPEYWKKQREWLLFHAPRIGGRYARGLVGGMVFEAVEAERVGREPVAWVVPESVKEIWRRADEKYRKEAWEQAAERYGKVKRLKG